MLVITSKLNTDKSVRVSVEGKGTNEEEIRGAYIALSQVVEYVCKHEKEGGDNNGQ